MIYVHPGRLYVGRGDERVTTILGSCVAVCLHDPVMGIGGLNHFLLPDSSNDKETSPRYAPAAVDRLVALMLREGAVVSRLEARIIGGARVLSAFPCDPNHLGLRNAAAASALLAARRIRVISSDIGGNRGRKLLFVPRDGTHQIHFLGSSPNAGHESPNNEVLDSGSPKSDDVSVRTTLTRGSCRTNSLHR